VGGNLSGAAAARVVIGLAGCGGVRRGEARYFLMTALMPLPGCGRVIFRVSRPELAASKLNRFAPPSSFRDFFPRSPPIPSSSRVPRYAFGARWAVSFYRVAPRLRNPGCRRCSAMSSPMFASLRRRRWLTTVKPRTRWRLWPRLSAAGSLTTFSPHSIPLIMLGRSGHAPLPRPGHGARPETDRARWLDPNLLAWPQLSLFYSP